MLARAPGEAGLRAGRMEERRRRLPGERGIGRASQTAAHSQPRVRERWSVGDARGARAACQLDTQKMLAGHTRDVDNLIDAQTERVTRIVEPLMEAVADTSERVARLEAGQDATTLQLRELVEQVADLTTKLNVVGTSSSEAAMTISAMVHEVEVVGAPAPPLFAPDAIADYDRPPDPAKLRVNMSRPVDRDVAKRLARTSGSCCSRGRSRSSTLCSASGSLARRRAGSLS